MAAREDGMTDSPYTPIPNYILDNMGNMKGSVFQIVCTVARKTLGWCGDDGKRKQWDTISLSQFIAQTGLSRPAVNAAIAEAIESGWIERRQNGQSFEYQLVKKVNQLSNDTSKEILPVEQSTSKEILPEVVKKVNTQKKEKKETNNTPNEEKETPEQQQWFAAVCWLVHNHQDYKLLSKEDKIAIGKTVKQIRDSAGDYTIDDLRSWYRDVWSQEWPGKQPGKTEIQRPTLKQIRVGIGAVKKEVPEQFAVNGHKRDGVWAMLVN